MTGADVTIHVAPNGRDDAPGTAAQPLATPAAAVAACRRLDGGPKTIVFHGGRYALATPLRLSSQDNGLTLAAAPGETPVLYGGRELLGWTPEADSPFWSAPAAGTGTGAWDFRQLYVNGEIRPNARLPEAGTWVHDSRFDRNHDACARFEPPPTVEERSTLVYGQGQLRPDFAARNAEVVVLHIWDDSHARVVAHDTVARKLTLDPPCIYPPGALGVKEFFVLNLREGMTKPGQWYLDRERERIVYWPQPGEEPNACTIDAPAISTLVHLAGDAGHPVTDITLAGLTFDLTALERGVTPGVWAEALAGAVQVRQACNCRLADLVVRRAGGQGIKLNHADHVTVERCDIAHVGANGIACNTGTRNTIAANRVRHVGEMHTNAVGIHGIDWSYGRIVGNEVSDCSYCGITLSNGNRPEPLPAQNIIENNHVWNVMNALNDGGCIYMAWSQRGTVIRGNRLHGAHGRTGGANGLYLDIDVDGVTCEHNLVYDIAQHALHVHMAKHNIIRNNTFICGPEGGISFMNSGACVFERNIVCGQQRGIQFADPDGARFTGNTYWTTAGAPRFEPALSFYNSQPFPHGHGEEVGHLAVLDPVPGIDTAPSAADWDRARTVDRFVNAHGNPPPAVHRHDVRFLRQGMLLHVRGRLGRPPVAAPVRRPGPSVWGSEHFDLWLKPFGDRSGFVQLGVTADGETAALWSSNAPAHFGWRASVQLLAGRPGWEVTLCIPLDELAAVFGGGTLAPAFQVGFAVANPAVDFAGWQALGRDPDGIIADPLFVDPVGGDFRLRSD